MSISKHGRPRDRRRSQRYNVEAAAKLCAGSRAVHGRLIDLSISGARVRIQEACHVQGEYMVSIPFGRDPEEAINLPAVTCHTSEDSVGLSWLGRVSVEVLMKLERLIEGEVKMPRVLLAPLPMFVWPPSRARQTR